MLAQFFFFSTSRKCIGAMFYIIYSLHNFSQLIISIMFSSKNNMQKLNIIKNKIIKYNTIHFFYSIMLCCRILLDLISATFCISSLYLLYVI